MNINDTGLTNNPDNLRELARDPEHLKKLVALWADNTFVHHLAAELLAVREAAPYGYLRENDGQVQISIGPERPPNRSGGYATPWGAIYAAPPELPANVIGRPATPDDSPYPATISGGCLLAQAWADGYNVRNAVTTAPAPAKHITYFYSTPSSKSDNIYRDVVRYQFLRDKDAFGADNEPGLIGWDELTDLSMDEFDAAIDARMAHPDIAYTAPPVPAQPLEVTDEMAMAFHRALTDSDIGSDDLDDIKIGLRGALCNYTAPPAPAVPAELLDAMAEVIRISDRDHEAWDRAKAAISTCLPDGENCWSCGKYFTYAQHSECDGYCPHCNAPVDLDDEDQPSQVVPVEPTEDMVAKAWREALGKCDHETIKRMYATMLAAAPTPTKAVNDAQKK
jgi:hypothetical protein